MKPTFLLAFTALGGAASAEVVHGTLVDASGKPLVGVRLTGRAFRHLAERYYGGVELRATTGKDGGFTILNAPTKPTEALPILLMGRLRDGRFMPVALTSEGKTTWRAGPTSTLTLRVVDAKGKPLAGATARLTDAIASNLPSSRNAPILYLTSLGDEGPSALTNAGGTARIEGIPVSRAWYAVRKPGTVGVEGNVLLPKDAGAQATLNPSAVLRGRVLRDGKPVAGVGVVATTIVQNRAIQDRTKTDADGAYRLDAAPGPVSIGVDPSAVGGEWVAQPYVDVRVAVGEERNGLNLALERGVLLRGQVLTKEGGLPVRDASVNLFGRGYDNVQALMTDAQGRFSARVAPGQWSLTTQEVGGRSLHERAELSVTVDAAHNPPLELRVAETALFPPIPHLSGTVVDAKGMAVEGATVRNLVGGATATTDAAGRFRFEKSTDPGGLLVVAKGDAMSTRSVRVTDRTEMDLALDGKAAELQGVVTDDEGKPLAGVAVSLTGEMDGGYFGVPDTTTDANGTYRFEGVYGGLDSFFLWAKKPGYGAVTIQPIKTTPGETKTMETQKMALADGTIDGQVLETDGKPAAGVTVSSQVDGVPTVETDARGRFHLTGVPRGKRFLAAGRANVYNSVADGATGQTDVVIRLKPESKPIPGLVSGDRTGHVAPEIRVATWTNNGPVDLRRLKGRIVVIDLWAVWCGPCVASLPDVQRLSLRYASKGVTVIGIHAPGTPAATVAKFAKDKGLSYPVALDVEESSGVGMTAKAFGFTGIPHLLVIDAKGQVAADTSDVDVVEKAIRRLLQAKAP